jgi:hypothetical protein
MTTCHLALLAVGPLNEECDVSDNPDRTSGRLQVLLLVFLGLISTLTAGCSHTDAPLNEQSFEFLSGGAYRLEGYGEWRFNLDANGQASITHQVLDDVTGEWNLQLTQEENSELWQKIRHSGLQSRQSSTRAGLPDELQFHFVLKDAEGSHDIDIWINDAREAERIVELIDMIGELIEKYTQEQTVLW